MPRFLICPLSRLVFLACLALAAASAPAAGIYEFVQDGTGDTLAYLELSSLPATHNQVVSLTFTPAGDAIYGLGETYDGVFDSALESFVDSGDGILVSSNPPGGANITDSNPTEPSALIGELYDVIIGTSNPGEPVDTILLTNVNFDPPIFATGSFVRIPEPATVCLVGVALIVAGGRRCRT